MTHLLPGGADRSTLNLARIRIAKNASIRLLLLGNRLSVGANFETYWQGRSALLELELRTVNRGIKRGDLAGVRLEKGEIVLTPLARAAPLEARALSERLYAELPRVKITDLLADVAGWTHYDRTFKHLQSGKPFERLETLLTAILADGINLGATRMAEATPGATARQLSWVSDWYLRDDTYAGAIAELTNFQHKLPLARFWGDGTTSSSDGQHFKTGSHGASHGAVNARYGHAAGVTFYTHVSDQYAPFHTRVINTTKRDATFVLDGLLYHESDLLIDEHYTDTNGYTEHVFALCHLLGFRFAPRIRNLAESKLYTPSKSASYPELESMIGGTLSKKLLETHWEDILRLATSIRRGTVTASLMLSKLGAYPRQNGLATALRELGRLERGLFTLEWLQDPALQRRVLVGLNKGESRNALADAVFFNQRGELRDRSWQAQSNRASGLSLLISCINIWNTVQLERVIERLRASGEVISDELLRHVSPLGWEHIGLTGEYIWRSR